MMEKVFELIFMYYLPITILVILGFLISFFVVVLFWGLFFYSETDDLPKENIRTKNFSKPITASAVTANNKDLFDLYEKIKRRAAEGSNKPSKRVLRY